MIIQKQSVCVCFMFLSVVLSECVYAGFSANNSVNHVDYLGLEWDVRREGKKYAIAIADSSSDTFESLAEKVKLDTKDYKEWAHTTDEKPRPCEKYKIPNTVYFHHGKEKPWDLKYSIVYTLYEMDKTRAVNLEKEGAFKIISKSEVSDSEITTALRDDYIYQYNFSGHGQPDGINSYKSSGVLAQRYTKYGINRLQLNSCYSALKGKQAPVFYTYNEWEWNVAKRGMFYGFSGGINMWNVFDQLRATHGKNRKDILE